MCKYSFIINYCVKKWILVLVVVGIGIMMPDAHAADEYVKITQEKFTIIKYQSILPEIDSIKIELLNLNATAINSENPRVFKIIKSDFVASSIDRLSFADKMLPANQVSITNKDGNQLTDITVAGNTEFYITTTTSETDTATYSGKIYLQNDLQTIPISIEIKIIHNFFEIIAWNLGSILVSTIIFLAFWNNPINYSSYVFDSGDSHPILIVLTTIVTIPSVLLITSVLVGNPILDNLIAAGSGMVIIGKMMKKNPDGKTGLSFSITVNKELKDLEEQKAEIINKLNSNEKVSEWLNHDKELGDAEKGRIGI